MSGQRAHLNNNCTHSKNNNNNNTINNVNNNPVLAKEIKSLKKEKKKKLSKVDIGQPTNFVHWRHVGLDKAPGAVMNQVRAAGAKSDAIDSIGRERRKEGGTN